MIILVVGGGYVVWDRYLSPQAKLNRETQANYQKYLEWEEQYQKAMSEDTYGGKTPQETLDLFIKALRAEDIELASKYFMLNEVGEVDRKWIDYLKNVKDRGLLQQMANDIERDARLGNSAYQGDAGFVLFNDDGTVGVQIDMKLNSMSEVWKIESL